MIGQETIKSWILHNKDHMPSFLIIVGGRGCGKRTLARFIAKTCGLIYSQCDIKVEAVRDVIHTAYTVSSPVLFCFPDCDTMRVEAKNALLKVTEEPPKNCKFVMTVCDDSKILDTLKSRGTILRLQPYNELDMAEYAKKYEPSELRDVAVEVSTNPRIFDCIMEYGKEFIDYVELVADNICEVQPANAFKSSNKLALKANSEGYDLEVFWLMFCNVMDRYIRQCTTSWQFLNYCNAILVTDPYISKASKLGVNKQQLYDDWVFNIREKWEF